VLNPRRLKHSKSTSKANVDIGFCYLLSSMKANGFLDKPHMIIVDEKGLSNESPIILFPSS